MGEGWDEGQFFLPLLRWEMAWGEDQFFSTPSPVGEGRGEGQIFSAPSPERRIEVRVKSSHTPSPMAEG